VSKFVPLSDHHLLGSTERVDYYFTFSPTACRKDPKRRFVLLSLKSKDENSPLLPLPEMVTSITDHPLHSLLKGDDNASELLANLMGSGPWTFPMALTVPSAWGSLHFSNKNNRAPIEISHMLKVTIRAQRGDDQYIDSESGKRKQFDIVMRMPVHILSVRLCVFNEEKLFALTHTVHLRFIYSLCRTPSTPLSRATPSLPMYHPHRPHRPHLAPHSRTMNALNSTPVVRLYHHVRFLRMYSHLSHHLKRGHRLK
jgi:hypothetical protein